MSTQHRPVRVSEGTGEASVSDEKAEAMVLPEPLRACAGAGLQEQGQCGQLGLGRF